MQPDVPPQQIQLLISVRNSEEIAPALDGGCDILDFKEPSRGPLGMIDSETCAALDACFLSQPSPVPLSMALGELIDWNDSDQPPTIPAAIQYLKMGLSQTGEISDWDTRWLNFRKRVEEENRQAYPWIAVAYADWEEAHSVSPQAILSAAIESECTGLLIDTCHKRGQSLLDFLSPAELHALKRGAQSNQMLFALAGSVRLSDLPILSEIAPDIIGVRGAVCRGQQRKEAVELNAVRAFRRKLDQEQLLSRSG